MVTNNASENKALNNNNQRFGRAQVVQNLSFPSVPILNIAFSIYLAF